jgi:hypothetical protein
MDILHNQWFHACPIEANELTSSVDVHKGFSLYEVSNII